MVELCSNSSVIPDLTPEGSSSGGAGMGAGEQAGEERGGEVEQRTLVSWLVLVLVKPFIYKYSFS